MVVVCGVAGCKALRALAAAEPPPSESVSSSVSAARMTSRRGRAAQSINTYRQTAEGCTPR